ncbi:hypothetical protein [Idiomarina sp. HP20-50]|uniref:hypothetical protein n=1 Tax=Idiomarina sp. HP20-50 TaxID=3070813 RepID=UPI00294B8B21|nr:hypothetical protein [Idiomarina sp. HP20-50]MDV6316446.1 hypothetical protein [Idiomarina sp. HP20-50]
MLNVLALQSLSSVDQSQSEELAAANSGVSNCCTGCSSLSTGGCGGTKEKELL